MTDNLILYELQKIHKPLTKTNKDDTLNFRIVKSIFEFSEPILNTAQLGLIRLSIYNSVFNVNRRNYQFLYVVHYEYTSFNVNSTGEVSPDAYPEDMNFLM